MAARRKVVALMVSIVAISAAPGTAEMRAASLVAPLDRGFPDASDPASPAFRMPQGDMTSPGELRRSGLVAVVPIEPNFEVGIGRFRVVDPARRATHTEYDRQPMSVRPRERGIAAVGVSLRF